MTEAIPKPTGVYLQWQDSRTGDYVKMDTGIRQIMARSKAPFADTAMSAEEPDNLGAGW